MDDTHLPQRFELVRHEDNTGTSGTGVVAVGVVYPDGAVHMMWLNDTNDDLTTDSNGVAFKPAPDGVEATREIHGHEGRTEIRWVDTAGVIGGSDTTALAEIDDGPYLLVYERSDGDYTVAYNHDGVDEVGGLSFTYEDRIELPHPMTGAAAFRWLATTEEAYDALAAIIGTEGAEQVREDTRQARLDGNV